MSKPPGTLIATVGSKPQVITAAVDLLPDAGHALGEVVVLHTDAATGLLASAIDRLRVEAASYVPYRPLRWTFQPILGAVLQAKRTDPGVRYI
jgi:hypothetical protein